MITIEDDGASMFLDIVEASIGEGRRCTVEEAERLLSTRAMSFTLSAYEKLLGLTWDDMVSILVNLGSERPVETVNSPQLIHVDINTSAIYFSSICLK
jgi:hypothetical protein